MKTKNETKHIFQKWAKLISISSLLLATSCTQEGIQSDDIDTSLLESDLSSKSVELSISKLTASTEQSSNPVSNAIDGSGSTRWSGYGDSASLYFDLGSVKLVDYLKISYFKGDERKNYFSYWISEDGKDWTYVQKKTSTGKTDDYETFDLRNKETRYVRVKAEGTSKGKWNSINEIVIYGRPSEVNPSAVTTTTNPSSTVTTSDTKITSETKTSEENKNSDLSSSVAPSKNFDLSEWYLSVPVDRGNGTATSISVDDLNSGYEHSRYFYTGSDGGMVFVNYPKDAVKTSKNTSYSRTELREYLYGDDAGAKDDRNNWFFSSSDDISSKAGGVDGVLTATLAVNRVTTTASKDVQKGRIIIGQIHASDNEPNRLYYHKLPGHDKGAIYVAHETYKGDEEFINIVGNYVESDGDLRKNVSSPSDGVELGEVFSYEIKVIGDKQWVTVSREGKSDIVTYIDMSKSGYDNGDYMYFKAGVYSQNKTCKSSSDYDKVTFYALENIH